MEEMLEETLEQTPNGAQEDLGEAVSNPENLTSTEPEINEQEQEIALWMKSNEYKNGMWKSPDDVYNSVQYYQQKFTPLEQAVKELGFESPDELKKALTEYKETLPEYEKGYEILQHLNAMVQDPEYGQNIRKAIQDYQIAKEREKYGVSLSELPEQFREQLTAGVQAKEMLEKMQSEKEVETLISTIDTQIKGIEELCRDYSMSLDSQAFLEHCKQNQVPAQYIKGYFMENYFDKLVQAAQTKASLAAVNKNEQVKAASVVSSQKIPEHTPQIPDDSAGLASAILSKL